MPAEVLTVAEVAALYRVDRRTVLRMIENDRLPAFRLGPKTLRVRRADAEAAMKPGGAHAAA